MAAAFRPSPKTGIDARNLARWKGVCLPAQSNDKSDGPLVVVAKADGPLAQTQRLGAACGCAMKSHGGSAACVGNDFQVDPTYAVPPCTCSQGFGDRLFGGETGGEGLNAFTAVAQLRLSVKALQESFARGRGVFVTRDGPANSFDFYNIDTCAQHHSLFGALAAELRLHHGAPRSVLRRAAVARTGW